MRGSCWMTVYRAMLCLHSMQREPISSSRKCTNLTLGTLSSQIGCLPHQHQKWRWIALLSLSQRSHRPIKRMKSASAPSPFDMIGYVVFKKCPALIPALIDLFNLCWAHSYVPHQWKTAAIKLIAKGPAAEDAANPANFRPIALTPCIGKIFTTLLRNRWLKFMLLNQYFDPSLQKAFLPTTPSCTEHQLKLSSILNEAQAKHKALAVCWLDLANAYGSVHHSLIEFSLRHYNAPPQFLSMMQALYSDPWWSVRPCHIIEADDITSVQSRQF